MAWRFSVRTCRPGSVTYATSASGPIGDAGYANPIVVPASSLVQGVNVLAVEVHQVTSATTSSGIVLTGGGLALVEEGPVGGTRADEPGAAAGRRRRSSSIRWPGYPIHDYLHLNDGVYGNANSWIGNSGNPGYAGVRFGGQFTISSIAFGRDNTATYSDRTLGLYTLQYTRVASPGTGTTVTQNPDTGWANIGTLNYQSAGTGLFANPSRRHRFTFTPVDATGIRLVVPGTGIGAGTCIDELEVNPPDTSRRYRVRRGTVAHHHAGARAALPKLRRGMGRVVQSLDECRGPDGLAAGRGHRFSFHQRAGRSAGRLRGRRARRGGVASEVAGSGRGHRR